MSAHLSQSGAWGSRTGLHRTQPSVLQGGSSSRLRSFDETLTKNSSSPRKPGICYTYMLCSISQLFIPQWKTGSVSSLCSPRQTQHRDQAP